MGPRAVLDVLGNRKISCPNHNSNPGLSSRHPFLYTDSTVQTLLMLNTSHVVPSRMEAFPFDNSNFQWTTRILIARAWLRVFVWQNLAKPSSSGQQNCVHGRSISTQDGGRFVPENTASHTKRYSHSLLWGNNLREPCKIWRSGKE